MKNQSELEVSKYYTNKEDLSRHKYMSLPCMVTHGMYTQALPINKTCFTMQTLDQFVFLAVYM